MAKIKWTQIVCPKCKRNLLKVNPEQAEFYFKGIQCPCGRNVLVTDMMKQLGREVSK